MTVITNMVVALMIVTQGEEPVQAMPVEWQWGSYMLCSSTNTFSYPYPATGGIETLYRKTCKTNFVYSTTVPIRALRCRCNEFGCSEMHNCTFEELLGRRIRELYIEHDTPAYCERHKKLLK